MRKRVMREKIYTRRKRGRPKVRWLDDVQEDLWAMGIEGWSTRGQGSRRAVETGGGGCGGFGCRFQRLRGQSTSFNLLFVVDSTTTDSMEQSPSGEANRSSASQEIPRILWNPKVYYNIKKLQHLSLSWPISIQSVPLHFTS